MDCITQRDSEVSQTNTVKQQDSVQVNVPTPQVCPNPNPFVIVPPAPPSAESSSPISTELHPLPESQQSTILLIGMAN